MDKKELIKRNKFWKEFLLWENSCAADKKEKRFAISVIGEMIDFYFKKYPEKTRNSHFPVSEKDYHGIMQLHQKLFLWRKKYAH